MICVDKALSIYRKGGLYEQAGRICRKLAIVYERENDQDLAIAYYKKASRHFQEEHMYLESNGCLLSLANLMGSLTTTDRHYIEAATIFLDLGRYATKENLLKFNASDHFFRCGLLLLAFNDMILLEERFIPRFYEYDIFFKNSREHDFLLNIASAIKLENIHKFADHIFLYHVAVGLDSWCLTLLNKMRLFIEKYD